MARPPIAYLPGGGGRSSFWRPVADRLAFVGAPMVFGYPGFGDVPPQPRWSSLDDLYAALLEILPPTFDVVAQSMGAVLALRLALEQPGRVRRLVLTAVSGGIDVRQFGAAEWREALRREQPDAPRWFIEDASDFGARLGEVRAPTLLLFGKDDPLAPVAVAEFMRARLPRADLHVLDGSHSFACERAEATAALIGAHLSAPL